MSEPAHGVVITLREVYDLITRLDVKVTQLAEARRYEQEQRSAMMTRMDEIEESLKQLQMRMAAWPALAAIAAIVAISVGLAGALR